MPKDVFWNYFLDCRYCLYFLRQEFSQKERVAMPLSRVVQSYFKCFSRGWSHHELWKSFQVPTWILPESFYVTIRRSPYLQCISLWCPTESFQSSSNDKVGHSTTRLLIYAKYSRALEMVNVHQIKCNTWNILRQSTLFQSTQCELSYVQVTDFDSNADLE